MSAYIRTLDSDESLRRERFPVASRRTFLAHAAVCPLPAVVAGAMAAWCLRAAAEGQFEHLHASAETGCRQRAATLIGGSPDEIAFAGSTSAALAMVAEGLDLSEGDSVLVADRDFPANLHPWLALRRRGVRVARLPRSPDGRISVGDVEAALDPSVRLVALSSAHFGVGTPIDHAAIGALLRRRGILFCLDAIQTLGAHPVDVGHVDFLAADAHKWLLGPQGIAILHVSRNVQDRLRPALVGWKSVQGAKEYGSRDAELVEDARRYEPGSLSPAGLVGLDAALGLLLEVGIPAISERVRGLRAQALEGLLALGCDPTPGVDAAAATGILAFSPPPGFDPLAIGKRLDEAGFVLSVREDLLGGKRLRLAPHFYNTPAEIDAFLSTLGGILSRTS